jgi:NADH-quinone oxidoreductase subunit G
MSENLPPSSAQLDSENVTGAEAAVAIEKPSLQYQSEYAVVDALPPGYSQRPVGEPERATITFTIDGDEVQAPEGLMLVDAAKYGGVEIPVFCYEPKLGAPVGACRMCLVEIEGIPKLQTACSTPVRDGMVVVTKSERVIEAQNSVVEFLLANHPLDCPVCDKGGECPLQDISYGWGRGKSRFSEPKRHFEKPVALSPSIAIDRERCILCYRCVRFSQEVSEDYQLVLLERGYDSHVGTFDGTQYIAPFSGNIIELCPVGALTSRAYRFRARPWDIEQGGSVCTMCPGQCNVSYTVRDDKVMRVLARDNNAVDDGWLCDRGRFAHQAWESEARITQPLVRQGDKLLPARWDHALDVAASLLKKAGASAAALAGGGTTNEEAWLLGRLFKEALGSDAVGASPAPREADLQLALDQPDVQLTVPDLEWADAILVIGTEPIDDMPVIDLRVRKAVNRNGAKLCVASARPSALDEKAGDVLRHSPAGPDADTLARATEFLSAAERPAIVWGAGVPAEWVANTLDALNVATRPGGGQLEVTRDSNARGMREVGLTGDAASKILAGEVGALLLSGVDPVADYPASEDWNAAIAKVPAVISFATWLDPTAERHADVIFPLEVGPEKEGTVTHPDGRIQRLRQTTERAGEVNAGWWALQQLGERLGSDLGVTFVHQATRQIADGVAIYAGVTPDEIGGTGVRWQEREAAKNLPTATKKTFDFTPAAAPQTDGKLALGTFRSIWGGGDVANAPTLAPLVSRSRIELSPADGERLGVKTGDEVTLATESGELTAVVALRDAVEPGAAFLLDTRDDDMRRIVAGAPELVEVKA